MPSETPRRFERRWGAPTLIAVSGVADAALTAALAQAKLLVDPEFAAVDTLVVEPSGERWTVEEVRALIVQPAQRAAYGDRRAIVVREADRMAGGAADRLLVAVEEPTSPTTFIFVVPTLDDLQVTLRSRVVTHIEAGVDAETQQKWETTLGCNVVQFFSAVPGWLIAGVEHAEVRSALAAAATLPNSQPRGSAGRVFEALEVLAKFDTTTGLEQGAKPERTARLRRGATAVIDGWRHHVSLTAADRSQSAQADARRLDTAAKGVALNLNVQTALAVGAVAVPVKPAI